MDNRSPQSNSVSSQSSWHHWGSVWQRVPQKKNLWGPHPSITEASGFYCFSLTLWKINHLLSLEKVWWQGAANTLLHYNNRLLSSLSPHIIYDTLSHETEAKAMLSSVTHRRTNGPQIEFSVGSYKSVKEYYNCAIQCLEWHSCKKNCSISFCNNIHFVTKHLFIYLFINFS